MSGLMTAGRFPCLLEARAPHPAPIWDTRLVESDGFIATPTKGSIVPGWVLLIPKRHVFSFRQLTTAEMLEAETQVKRISATLSRFFGPVTIFEHGAAYSGSALGCGVDHAHLHVVSLVMDLVAEALRDHKLQWNPLRHWSEFRSEVPLGSEYLLVSNIEKNAYLTNSVPPVGQYFRRLIAKLSGQQERWDYQTFPFAENARATVEAFASSISPSYSLPRVHNAKAS